ncbi:hypothetical protein [Algoriphagus aquimarinus]|uniref:Uncharacterized protein n=1 Tax=Algoriphagus aquimarinus TaxID=237018 RepID=A0A1I0VLH1_9BACT|nr:hypothetical protein [Algoriphagus aquimarinus]SFA77255.1 hypothetical protein SAMN04489723_101260 [Algoriphagus aquimarinus]
MKKALFIFLLMPFSLIIYGQNIESIFVQVMLSDEPPTKYGPQVFEIAFVSKGSKSLSADYYTNQYKKKKKVKLQEPIVIETQQLEKFYNWVSTNKSEFLLDELGVGISNLGLSNTSYKTTFKIDEEKIRIDSFNICKGWQNLRSSSTGGFSVKVQMMKDGDSTEILNFRSNDIGMVKLDLQSLLIIQPILQNKIPEEMGTDGLFDKESLIELLNYYYKVVECEGYYYDEFIEQNPERTKAENRTKVGWNFTDYMNHRTKNYDYPQ